MCLIGNIWRWHAEDTSIFLIFQNNLEKKLNHEPSASTEMAYKYLTCQFFLQKPMFSSFFRLFRQISR